jgi:hypothetical protein
VVSSISVSSGGSSARESEGWGSSKRSLAREGVGVGSEMKIGSDWVVGRGLVDLCSMRRMRPSARRPLKVWITASAMGFSGKMISAIIMGVVEVNLQERISMGVLASVVMALSAASMSGTVVPGAKLLASRVKRPAAPLMLRPGPRGVGPVGTLACCLLLKAVASLFVLAMFAVAELGLDGGLKEEGLTFVLEFDRYRWRCIVSVAFDRRS